MSERVLVTGAFGNLGQTVLAELKDRGHHVTVLARDKPRNRRTARRLGGLVDDVAWGDVRSADLDALVAAGRALLRDNPEFRRMVGQLGGSAAR